MALSHEAPGESDTKIYEMRTYYVKPKAFGKGNNMIVLPYRFSSTKNYVLQKIKKLKKATTTGTNLTSKFPLTFPYIF